MHIGYFDTEYCYSFEIPCHNYNRLGQCRHTFRQVIHIGSFFLMHRMAPPCVEFSVCLPVCFIYSNVCCPLLSLSTSSISLHFISIFWKAAGLLSSGKGVLLILKGAVRIGETLLSQLASFSSYFEICHKGAGIIAEMIMPKKLVLIGLRDWRWPMTWQASGMRTNDLLVAIGCRPTTNAISFWLVSGTEVGFGPLSYTSSAYGVVKTPYGPFQYGLASLS